MITTEFLVVSGVSALAGWLVGSATLGFPLERRLLGCLAARLQKSKGRPSIQEFWGKKEKR